MEEEKEKIIKDFLWEKMRDFKEYAIYYRDIHQGKITLNIDDNNIKAINTSAPASQDHTYAKTPHNDL